MTTADSTPDSLYVLVNPRIPGEIKIGRSRTPFERAKQLSNGQNFRLVVKHLYKDKGFLEKTIHNKLKRRQVQEGAGTEWFKVSAKEADTLIKATIFEDSLSKEVKIETEEEIATKSAAGDAYFAQLLENELVWRIKNNLLPIPDYLTHLVEPGKDARFQEAAQSSLPSDQLQPEHPGQCHRRF